MQGSNKIQFENEYIPACIKNQTASSLNKKYTPLEIKNYCNCVSNHITDRATVKDVNVTSERLLKIIDDAGLLCAARLLIKN